MKINRLVTRRGIAPLLFTIGVLGMPLAQARAGAYTITKIIDSLTPVPDRPGKTFPIQSAYGTLAIDGNTIVFFAGDGSTDGALWSMPASPSATPVRLVDGTTTAPGNTGPFSPQYPGNAFGLGIEDVRNGYAVFNAWSPQSFGYYSVPEGGGAVATLFNGATNQPNIRGGNYTADNGARIFGSQVFFSVDFNQTPFKSGIYSTPIASGAFTLFGGSSTPINGDPRGTLYPARNGSYPPAFNSASIAFQPKLGPRDLSNYTAIYTAPVTGLTLDGTTGFVNNATRVVSGDSLIPGDAQGRLFDGTYLRVLELDDSGALVFCGQPAGNDFNSGGIFLSFNGVLSPLVTAANSVPGDAGHFLDIQFGTFTDKALNGQVAFTSYYTRADGSQVQGIYTVRVADGAIAKVAEQGDTLPDGSTLVIVNTPPTGLNSSGAVVFSAAFQTPGASSQSQGIFLATPNGGAPPPGANPLILNNHTGGDTGAVTLTITPAPGAAAFTGGATFKLSATGQPDIVGQNAVLNAAGTAYTVTFDLKGQTDGLYDLVLTNTSGSTVTQTGAFTVEAATGPILYGDILGRESLRAGAPAIYTFLVGNRGDTDAAMVPLFINFPSYFSAQLVTPLAPIPLAAQVDPTFDLTQLPLITTNGDHQLIPLFLPKIPAGTIKTVQVLLTCPDVPQYAHAPFSLSVQFGEPTIDAETGMPPVASAAPAVKPGGEHVAAAGLTYTCVASAANLAIDCASVFVPALQGLKCGETLTLAATNIYLGVTSDNNYQTTALNYYQAEATGFIALVQCAVKTTPFVGTVLNGIQCGIDGILLEENCITPLLFLFAKTITSGDPNDLAGSLGDNTPAHYLTGTQPLRYAVYFQNEPTASAAAQTVVVTNPLDVNLDLSTFSLGPIGFGSTVLNPPAGSTNYTTTVDLRPATNLLVKVSATMDAPSRMLTYRFQSLDPATNQPTTDPSAGFLPPDTNPPAGDGFAIFSAKPVSGLSTGTAITDQASIVFDANAPIATPVWTNTIDNDAPASQLAALPKKVKRAQIKLQVSGTDAGSGVSFYNVFGSEDGGPFQPLVQNAPGPQITYGGVAGHKYAFFSQAVDKAGNIEAVKTAAEATTKIVGADLVGSWVSGVTEKMTASGNVRLKGQLTVLNQAAKSATANGSLVRFYLCASSTFDGSQQVIGLDAPFGVLAAGASVDVPLKRAKLAAGAASGKFVIAVIDPDKQVKEADRTNNQVSFGPLP